jgi:hypothetical protein
MLNGLNVGWIAPVLFEFSTQMSLGNAPSCRLTASPYPFDTTSILQLGHQ